MADYNESALARAARLRTQVYTGGLTVGVKLAEAKRGGVAPSLARAFHMLGRVIENALQQESYEAARKRRTISPTMGDRALAKPRFQPKGWAEQVSDNGVRPSWGAAGEHPGIRVHQHKAGRLCHHSRKLWSRDHGALAPRSRKPANSKPRR